MAHSSSRRQRPQMLVGTCAVPPTLSESPFLKWSSSLSMVSVLWSDCGEVSYEFITLIISHSVGLRKCLTLASSWLPHKISGISFYHFSLHSPLPLLMTAPARVVTEGGRVTGHAGQVVTVTCEATGDDPLTLTWLRHHAPVAPGLTYVFPHLVGTLLRFILNCARSCSLDMRYHCAQCQDLYSVQQPG